MMSSAARLALVATLSACSPADELQVVMPDGVQPPAAARQAALDLVVTERSDVWFGPVSMTEARGKEHAFTHVLTEQSDGPPVALKVKPRSLGDLDGAVIAVTVLDSVEFLSLVATAMSAGMRVEVLSHYRQIPPEGAIGVIPSGDAELSRIWFDHGLVDGAFGVENRTSLTLRTRARWLVSDTAGRFVAPPGTGRAQFEPLPSWADLALRSPKPPPVTRSRFRQLDSLSLHDGRLVGVDIDSGNIWERDAGRPRVLLMRERSSGRFDAVAAAANGLLVADNRAEAIVEYGPNGGRRSTFPISGLVTDLTVDDRGRIVAALSDRNEIAVIEPATAAVAHTLGSLGLGRGEFEGLSRVAAGGGQVYGLDTVKNVVQVFDDQGGWVGEIPSAGQPRIEQLVAADVDADGTCWIVDGGRAELLGFARDQSVRAVDLPQLRGVSDMVIDGQTAVLFDALAGRLTEVELTNGRPVKSVELVPTQFTIGTYAVDYRPRDFEPLATELAKALGRDIGRVARFDSVADATRALNEGRVDALITSGVVALQISGDREELAIAAVGAEREPAAAVLVAPPDTDMHGATIAVPGSDGLFENAEALREQHASGATLELVTSDATALGWAQTGRASAAVVRLSLWQSASPPELVEVARGPSVVAIAVVAKAQNSASITDAFEGLEGQQALGPARIASFDALDPGTELFQNTLSIARRQ